MTERSHWLLKTEPDTFSFADLLASPGQTTAWEGVRNYQARNLMRDAFKIGDPVLIYHSSCAEPAIVGTGEVVAMASPDPSAMDPKSPYFDPKSQAAGASRWVLVHIRAVGRLQTPLSLARLRSMPGLDDLMLLKRGSRLSIQPVSEATWRVIMAAAGPLDRPQTQKDKPSPTFMA